MHMKGNTILFFSRHDVEKVNLPMSDIIDALDLMFEEKGEGQVEMPLSRVFIPGPMHLSMQCRRTFLPLVPRA